MAVRARVGEQRLQPFNTRNRDPRTSSAAARNENLINGDTAGLHQQLVLRPIRRLGRADKGIRELCLAARTGQV